MFVKDLKVDFSHCLCFLLTESVIVTYADGAFVGPAISYDAFSSDVESQSITSIAVRGKKTLNV